MPLLVDARIQSRCGHVLRREAGRFGIYYVETGANQRPSRVYMTAITVRFRYVQAMSMIGMLSL